MKQGDLTPNDNGSNKFNKSEIRYEDELIMKWIVHINDRLIESSELEESVLVYFEKDKEWLSYTQIEYFSFTKIIVLKEDADVYDILKQLSEEGYTRFVIAAPKENDFVSDIGDVIWLMEYTLYDIWKTKSYSEILPNVKLELRKNTLEKIKRLNDELETISREEKVLIYGSGYQAEVFFRYANINRLNIIGVVDKNKVDIFDIPVNGTEREHLCNADVIIVTPFFAANQIKGYLDSLNLNAKFIYISELCGNVLFSGQENLWAPDKDIRDDEQDVNIEYEINQIIECAKEINDRSAYYCALRKYTASDMSVTRSNAQKLFEEKTAIVIQGPVVYKQDFTLETIRLYRKLFPEATIIVSVWEDELQIKQWYELESDKVEVVYSQRPEVRGYQNINLQLTTSYNGILRAKELGCQYVFKTRSDMRYYSSDMISLMQMFMEKYPLVETSIQKERLVIFPPRYDYFHLISDRFMFGNVDDMLNYWDVNKLFGNEYIGESAEAMLGIRYAELIGKRVENKLENLAEYQKLMMDYFVIVEDKMLDFIWYKYFYNKQWEFEYHNNIINFVDWLAGQERFE